MKSRKQGRSINQVEETSLFLSLSLFFYQRPIGVDRGCAEYIAHEFG